MSLVAQRLRLHLPTQEVLVSSLVLGAKIHMPLSRKKKKKNPNIKQKQCCNKFNKYFKEMTHTKKIFKWGVGGRLKRKGI